MQPPATDHPCQPRSLAAAATVSQVGSTQLRAIGVSRTREAWHNPRRQESMTVRGVSDVQTLRRSGAKRSIYIGELEWKSRVEEEEYQVARGLLFQRTRPGGCFLPFKSDFELNGAGHRNCLATSGLPLLASAAV
uniref:Uncharacterized protein n=1 Tax=Physcomitrium patens TaxID=3218 RepID=A0A7I4B6Z1_PHYPA